MLAGLKFREYRIFWIGNATSNIGIFMLMAGSLWLMNELTNAVLYLGILTFTGLGPILVLSMWGGVIADRVNRVRLVTITRGCFSATALITGLLVALNVIQPWHLISISLINGILLSFDIPSRQAMVPNLLPREHLVNAFALQSMLAPQALAADVANRISHFAPKAKRIIFLFMKDKKKSDLPKCHLSHKKDVLF